jgi:hypothetical protein
MAGVEALAPRRVPSVRSVPDASFFQFIGDLLFASGPDDRDLVRRSWHSIQRERRGRRLLLDTGRSEDRDLEWADGETRNFVLWQLPVRSTQGPEHAKPRLISRAARLLRKRGAGEHRDDNQSRQRHFRSEQIHFFLHSRVARVSYILFLHRTKSAL